MQQHALGAQGIHACSNMHWALKAFMHAATCIGRSRHSCRQHGTSELVVHAQVILPLLIFTFGPISGAHFNPMVTSVFVATKQMAGPSLMHLLIRILIYKSLAPL